MTIIHASRLNERGNPGDGRIFITNIDEGYTISDQLL
jgi:nitrogen regulatory protein PII